ncbi:MAG: patatin-like phospholipase family protein, partial [Myxococcales bacterium]|nr:patatin-like phospholipase family protein [Myxococcales bacterium]
MNSDYSIVLAGGGGRTVWGLSLLRELDLLQPQEWAGVSAGAAMAVFAASGRAEAVMDFFLAAAERNHANVHWGAWARGGRLFPHEGIYRATLAHALAEGGFQALQQAPPVRVLLAWMEPGHPKVRRAAAALREYGQRKKAGIIHGPDAPPLGLGYEVFTCQDAADAGEVVDRIIDTSATWPVTRLRKADGGTYVDGGLVENVPVRALSPAAQAGKVIVLLSRPTPTPPPSATRLYLAPQGPLPLPKWDYTSPD